MQQWQNIGSYFSTMFVLWSAVKPFYLRFTICSTKPGQTSVCHTLEAWRDKTKPAPAELAEGEKTKPAHAAPDDRDKTKPAYATTANRDKTKLAYAAPAEQDKIKPVYATLYRPGEKRPNQPIEARPNPCIPYFWANWVWSPANKVTPTGQQWTRTFYTRAAMDPYFLLTGQQWTRTFGSQTAMDPHFFLTDSNRPEILTHGKQWTRNLAHGEGHINPQNCQQSAPNL